MFENASAFILLSLLLPIIILYLLKPKPRTLKIPSLMLLLQAMQKSRLKSLIRTLIRDPLLLIQLITITLLVLSLVNPYYTGAAGAGRVTIVLDASASMGATDVLPDRFWHAVSIAGEYVKSGDRITIILAEDSPVLFLKDAGRQKALEALQRLKPKATATDLNGALIFAAEMMKDEKGRLAVISDFSGQDITLARKIIEKEGITAEFSQVGTGGSNVGIVEAAIEGSDLKFFVKNYNDAAEDVKIGIIQNGQVRSINKKLGQNSREFFQVPDIGAGRTEVAIENHDNLAIDNVLYVSMPEHAMQRVLLISDSPDKRTPLSIAFKSIPSLEVHEVSFNRAPRTFNYDLVVLYDYTKSSPLPGMMDDLRRYVESGGTLLFVAAEELQLMDTEGLLPVNVSGMADPSGFRIRDPGLVDHLGTSGYLKAKLRENAVELASANEGPVLAYWNKGKGKVVYLGINDRWGDFHLLDSYPVFWFKVLKFASPPGLNYRTGTLLPLGAEQRIEAPGSVLTTDILYLDQVGFYRIGDRTIASNLLDEQESDISVKTIDFEGKEQAAGGGIEKIHLDPVFLILALLFIFLELYYLRYRGDL